MGKAGVLADPSAKDAALFSPGVPSDEFTDLEELGHGQFGAVFQVT